MCRCSAVPFIDGLDHKTLTAAQGQVDRVTLEELDFEQACEFSGHAAGESGCVPDHPADFIVYMSHGLRRHSCDPQYVLACAGRALFITEHRNAKAECFTCKTEGPLRRFAFVLAPLKIDPKK